MGVVLNIGVCSAPRFVWGTGVLFASVQRCRVSNTDPSRNECGTTPQTCGNPDNCKEQRYGMLRAFDPVTLREIWNNQKSTNDAKSNAARDYWFAKFVPPTIAMGRVYLATGSDKVLV